MSAKKLKEINEILRKKTGCRLWWVKTLDVATARDLRTGYIAAAVLPKAVCFADNLFNRLFFVCLDKETAAEAESTAMALFAQGYPLIPEKPFVIEDCTGTPTAADLACFATVVIRECLANNGTPASAMRCPGFLFEMLALFAGKSKQRFLKALEDTPVVGVELECFEKYYRYNQTHESEWVAYAKTVFTKDVTTSPWGLTLNKYEIMMANIQGAFGMACVRNFAFLFTFLQTYSVCSLEEFQLQFNENSLIQLDLDSVDARFYQNLIRAAYIAGRSTGGCYLLDSLIGLDDYSASREFRRQPNILLSPPPFELFLPIYWYTVRKFLLTNTSS